ncbi:MAG: TetR/AcrR family transcriptional regulator [Myxococcota bacterium]
MADPTPSVRERILRAARKLFLAHGFNGSNLRVIAREANVSMGGIYHHFSSKQEIYEALLPNTELVRELPRVATMFRAPEFPENVAEIGREVVHLVRTHKDDFKLVYIDILEFQARNVRPIIGQMNDAFAQASETLLAHRRETGELADAHPAVITRCILDLFMHFHLTEVMLDQSLAERIGLDDDEVVEQMARILLHGILPCRT